MHSLELYFTVNDVSTTLHIHRI